MHPTPVYETIAMSWVAIILWSLRDRLRPGLLFALYLILAGAERFLIEFLRRNDDVFIGLTQAQLLSIAMIVAGVVWFAVAHARGGIARRPAPRLRLSAACRRRAG